MGVNKDGVGEGENGTGRVIERAGFQDPVPSVDEDVREEARGRKRNTGRAVSGVCSPTELGRGGLATASFQRSGKLLRCWRLSRFPLSMTYVMERIAHAEASADALIDGCVLYERPTPDPAPTERTELPGNAP